MPIKSVTHMRHGDVIVEGDEVARPTLPSHQSSPTFLTYPINFTRHPFAGTDPVYDAVNLQAKAARRQTQYVTFLSLTGLA